MKLRLLSLAAVFLSTIQSYSQTVSPDFVDGVVHFKLNDNSLLELDPYQSNVPALNLIFTIYGVDTIFKPFKMQGSALDKIYRLKFSNINLVENLITELELVADVEFAEKVPLYKTTAMPNDLDIQQWSLDKVNAQQAWDITTGSGNVVIAVVDNAVLHSHVDLAANRWVNTSEQNGLTGFDDDLNGYVDDIYGFDVADNDGNPEPPPGTANGSPFIHGTHVAGIAAAATNNNTGIASLAYNCKFMSVKCSPNSGAGDALTNAQDGVFYAMRAGADIISMSFGSSSGNGLLVSQLIINQAYSNGIVLIGAAGNDNTNVQFYPAAYSNVIAVGATDENDVKAGFSNYGSWIDVMAPGTNIYSTLPENGNTYGSSGGTSMAAPLVSGLAALILSNSQGLTPAQVKSSLQQGCDNIEAQNPSLNGQLGSGRINAYHSVSPVSIDENFNNHEFNVYPNPLKEGGSLFIDGQGKSSENVTVNVTDITGKLLSSEQMNLSGTTPIKYSFSNYTSGVYFFQLITENVNHTQKVIVY